MENVDFLHLAAESREIWDENARWWDGRMGEGNDWHRLLIGPAVERLLVVRPGQRVLELACGNGQFARRLASLQRRFFSWAGCSRPLARAIVRGSACRFRRSLASPTERPQS